jgi:group I intron endonuclease
MHYLYRITNLLNSKIYIGQSNNTRRWSQHTYFAKHPEKTGQYIHYAMSKYGIENFIFEVISTCQTQEEANEIESKLIKQYDSMNKQFGYNSRVGGIEGSRGSHSEETKEKIRQATIQQIAEKGHPALGTKRTSEQLQKLSEAHKNNPAEYTEEVRKHMSEAHIGIKDSEETKQKKSESAKEAWTKRISYKNIKCQAPNCFIEGKAKYKIINGIRYCNKHGLRMLRYGRLDTVQ